jgi:5'-3' exonuclease
MNILILIDTSYTIFYRYYATLRWYSLAHNEEFKNNISSESYIWFDNKIFLEKYEKMFLEGILRKNKIFNSLNSLLLFCLDTPKEKLWRNKIDCNYKSNRKLKVNDDLNIKLFFNYTITVIIPNIINKSKNINKIQIPNIEADDIIGIICAYLKKLSFKIYLISSDKDFYQLGYQNLVFINYKSKKEIILTTKEAKYELNKKIIFGDKSDCIPSIIKKRIKNKEKLIENENVLLKYLEDNEESMKQYEINKKMIDFNYIPNEYKLKVIEIFNNYSSKFYLN